METEYKVARLGDPLVGGGAITSSLFPEVLVNGIPIATRESETFCPIPFHGVGTIVTVLTPRVIVGGDELTGLAVATVGALASCGCAVADGSPDTYAGT